MRPRGPAVSRASRNPTLAANPSTKSQHKPGRAELKPPFPVRVSFGHSQDALDVVQVLEDIETRLKAEDLEGELKG
jgi:hypothetical protein